MGAFLSIILGYASVDEARETLFFVANPTITLILIVIISLILQKNGLFDFIALKLIKLSKGNTRVLYLLIILFGAILSSFFTNDGAILILTPIVLSKLRFLSLKKGAVVAFLMAAGFIADTSSLTFTISNLTNILSTEFYPISFNKFFINMFTVNLVSVAMSISMLFFLYRKDLPDRVNLDSDICPYAVITDKKLFYLSLVMMPLLFATFFILGYSQVPSSIILLPFTLILAAYAIYRGKIHFIEVLKYTPFNVIFFSLGMYILVLTLKSSIIFTFSVSLMGICIFHFFPLLSTC